MLMTILAIAGTCAGIALIRWVWRKDFARRDAALALGWALLLASVPLWIQGHGPEFGAVYALCAVSIAAWGFVGFNAALAPRTVGPARRSAPALPPVRTAAAQILRFFTVFLIVGTVSLAAALGTSRLLPTGEIDRLAFVVIVLPLYWGLFGFLALYLERVRTMFFSLAIPAVLGTLLFFLV